MTEYLRYPRFPLLEDIDFAICLYLHNIFFFNQVWWWTLWQWNYMCCTKIFSHYLQILSVCFSM